MIRAPKRPTLVAVSWRPFAIWQVQTTEADSGDRPNEYEAFGMFVKPYALKVYEHVKGASK